MQQSNVIFGALLLAYLLFITLRGELPAYITLLRGGGAANNSTGETTSSNAVVSGAQALLNNNPFDTSAIPAASNVSPQQAQGILDVFGQ